MKRAAVVAVLMAGALANAQNVAPRRHGRASWHLAARMFAPQVISGGNGGGGGGFSNPLGISILPITGINLGGLTQPFQYLYLYGDCTGGFGNCGGQMTVSGSLNNAFVTWTLPPFSGQISEQAAGIAQNHLVKTDSLGKLIDSSVVVDSSNNVTTSGSISSGTGTGVGGLMFVGQGTLPGTLPANSFGILAGTSITSSLFLRYPNANPAANQVCVFGAPTSNISDCVWTTFTASGMSNPMTTLGDVIYENATPAAARLAGPTTVNGVPWTLTEQASGGVAQAPAWALPGVPVDPQSGATYTVALTDRVSLVNTTNNTTSTAVTVPQAGSTNFASNFAFVHCNPGTVVATDTPTTSTVNGNATLKLLGATAGGNPECAFWWGDNTNYFSAEILPTDANGKLQVGAESTNSVLKNAANTYSGTGLQDMNTVDLRLPVHSSDPGTCTAGQIEFNSVGAAGKICTTTNTWTTLATGGAPAFSAITGATNTTAKMVVGAGANLGYSNSFSTGTVTANRLACFTASNTVGNCTALPANNVLGVFIDTSGNIQTNGTISVALDATVSVTFGDILCASTLTGSTAHDNGSTACANGEWVGIVQTTAASVSSATVMLRLQ